MQPTWKVVFCALLMGVAIGVALQSNLGHPKVNQTQSIQNNLK